MACMHICASNLRNFDNNLPKVAGFSVGNLESSIHKYERVHVAKKKNTPCYQTRIKQINISNIRVTYSLQIPLRNFPKYQDGLWHLYKRIWNKNVGQTLQNFQLLTFFYILHYLLLCATCWVFFLFDLNLQSI